MDRYKKELKGSSTRDAFKRHHKDLDGDFYAIDIDFCLVSKYPPGIVAYLDYKSTKDNVTFAEAIAYNELTKEAPVYVIEGDNPDTGPFVIRQYEKANWRPEPPIVQWKDEVMVEDWWGFEEWEAQIRSRYTRARSRPGMFVRYDEQ